LKIDDDRDDDDPSFFIFPTEHEAIDWSHVYWRQEGREYVRHLAGMPAAGSL
jgi:hypothetical protein